jgi:hypothetical protein
MIKVAVSQVIFFILVLGLSTSCNKKNNTEEPAAKVEDTVPDGGKKYDPEQVTNCLVNGENFSSCLLAVGHYYYTQEYGGKSPSIAANVTVSPGTRIHQFTPGWYSGTTQIVFNDSDLIAANIRTGISLFGVTGTSVIVLQAACNITSGLVSGLPCSLSTGLFVYQAVKGGRSADCDTGNAAISQNNCWISTSAPLYLSTTPKTPPVDCSGVRDSSGLVSADCKPAVSTFVYSVAYGGRGLVCPSGEQTLTSPCWAADLSATNSAYLSAPGAPGLPWCSWNTATTAECRAQVTEAGITPPDARSAAYVYEKQFGGRSVACSSNGNGYCWTEVPKSTLDLDLNPDNIRAGKRIFGIDGRYRGEGAWKSGAHRDAYAYPLALSDETEIYGGAGSKEAGLPDGYREVPSALTDTDAAYGSVIEAVDRTGWSTLTCGTGATGDILPVGFSSWTLRARMVHCAQVFSLNSQWDGPSRGNSGQSKWKLVSRSGNITSGKGREIWLDENTGMLWSSLIATNTNWCRATGSNNIGGNSAASDDPSDTCDNATYQNTTVSADSACFEGTGFTPGSLDQAGKAGLSLTSTPVVYWRNPTYYDYEVAEYNGIRFVLPDIGKALAANSTQAEWTATLYKVTVPSTSYDSAWTFSSKLGINHF